MSDAEVVQRLLESVGIKPSHVLADDVARLEVHQNRVVGAHLVPGLEVDTNELDDGIEAHFRFKTGAKIERPVHLCFGMLPERGIQRIILDVEVEDDASVQVLAHCTFPNAVEVEHRMDARIRLAPGAHYSYHERHVHGPGGGVQVIPHASVEVGQGGRFKTDFDLIKGRVGEMDIAYDAVCHAHSVLEMMARVSASGDDKVRIHEKARLVGEAARAALTTNIALRDDARAEVFNTIIADAPRARGHVDCKEIVQGRAVAKAVPIVEVNDPTAHVTHEAAIGSVDSKQLQTLLSRGLTEDQAVDLIIEGMLS